MDVECVFECATVQCFFLCRSGNGGVCKLQHIRVMRTQHHHHPPSHHHPPLHTAAVDAPATTPASDNGKATKTQRVVVITGASSGLGLAAAKALVSDGNTHVVMACRDYSKAELAAKVESVCVLFCIKGREVGCIVHRGVWFVRECALKGGGVVRVHLCFVHNGACL